MTATSSKPVGFLRPPPIRPMALGWQPRNVDKRSTHCSSNCRRCTRTSVLTPRWAMSQAATTVFPNAVVADRTPVSWASMAAGGDLLLGPQFAVERRHPEACRRIVRRVHDSSNAQVREKLLHIVQTAARQADVLRMVLGASDDARLVIGRQAHRLGLVELGILKCRQPNQSIAQTGRQSVPWRCRSDRRGSIRGSRATARSSGGSLRRREGGAVQGVASSSSAAARRTPTTRPRFSASRRSLDAGAIDLADARQERPLIGIRQNTVVEKDTVAAFPRSFCSGRAIRLPNRLEAACPDWGRSGHTNQARCPAGVPSFRSGGASRACAPARREWPPRRTARCARRCRSAIAPARPADPAAARFQDRSRILLPLRLVEIGRQEEAGFVLEHRVDAHDEVAAGVVLARKMPADHFVGDGQETVMRTGGAFDLGLLAQAPHPLVAAAADSPTCRSCDSRSGEDRHRRVRERASETRRSWPQAGTGDGLLRRAESHESPVV